MQGDLQRKRTDAGHSGCLMQTHPWSLDAWHRLRQGRAKCNFNHHKDTAGQRQRTQGSEGGGCRGTEEEGAGERRRRANCSPGTLRCTADTPPSTLCTMRLLLRVFCLLCVRARSYSILTYDAKPTSGTALQLDDRTLPHAETAALAHNIQHIKAPWHSTKYTKVAVFGEEGRGGHKCQCAVHHLAHEGLQ